jgi:hypothetical protein
LLEDVKPDLTEKEIYDLLNYTGNEIFDGVKSAEINMVQSLLKVILKKELN